MTGGVLPGYPGLMPAAEVTVSDHRDVADDLRRRIGEGEFAIGQRLPGELALATTYGVSRATVRTALAGLARRGLVVALRNFGWVVQAAQPTQGFDKMRSFAQWAEARGFSPSGRVVARERGGATAREARFLRVRPGEEVLRFVRLRALDGRVVMVERSTWAPWVIPIIDALPDDVHSTTRALAAAGISVVYGNHRIEAVPASTDDARLLDVRRSSPLLQVRRETFAKDGRVVELGEDRYLPHTVAFEAQAAGEAERPGAPD